LAARADQQRDIVDTAAIPPRTHNDDRDITRATRVDQIERGRAYVCMYVQSRGVFVVDRLYRTRECGAWCAVCDGLMPATEKSRRFSARHAALVHVKRARPAPLLPCLFLYDEHTRATSRAATAESVRDILSSGELSRAASDAARRCSSSARSPNAQRDNEHEQRVPRPRGPNRRKSHYASAHKLETSLLLPRPPCFAPCSCKAVVPTSAASRTLHHALVSLSLAA